LPFRHQHHARLAASPSRLHRPDRQSDARAFEAQPAFERAIALQRLALIHLCR
jgi:hypothetical protein